VTFWNSQWQICRLPQISWPAGTVSDRFVVCHRSRDLLEQSVTALASAADLVTCWNSQWQICRLLQTSWPAGTVSDRFVVCHRSRDLLEQWQIRSFKSYSRNLLRACIARITVSLYSMNFLTNTFPKTKPWTLTSCFMCAHAFIDQYHNYVVVKILIHLFIYDGNKSPIIVFFFY
jgi:hypothetical protein